LFRTNVLGAMSFLEAVAVGAPNARAVVLGSTGGVYGTPEAGGLPLAESARCNPVDLYSASKLASEHATRIVAARAGVRVIWARLFNLVGPGQDERHVCGRFAAQAAAIARGVLPPVMEVGNLEATRDFIDVRDAVRALAILARNGEPGTPYNVASGIETRIGDVLRGTLCAAGVENTTAVAQLPGRSGDIDRHFADIGRLRALGFKTRYDLAKSIADVVTYYLNETAAAAD
jgi:nucleoside-diphosphate-sugar epimerase